MGDTSILGLSDGSFKVGLEELFGTSDTKNEATPNSFSYPCHKIGSKDSYMEICGNGKTYFDITLIENNKTFLRSTIRYIEGKMLFIKISIPWPNLNSL